MSTVDRYRPSRESYQPPSLPAKPPPPGVDRLSKSPTRRRDVPPAVPSPPTHSSRTSPPRPHSRRSAPSPARSSPQRAPQPRPDQWFFTADEAASSPSILDNLPLAEERLRRAKGVNFIYQAGILLELPQTTLWVAGVFFHRFYMRYSMVEEKGGIHHYNIAATALFLANKTEENCRKTKDLIIAVAKVAQKNTRLVIDEQSKEYWKWRDSILAYEELMLEALTFDLLVDNPYTRLREQLGQLDLLHRRALRDSAWAFCNDACLTVLPLLLPARDVAVAAIFFAASVLREPIDDVAGLPWWQFLRAGENKTVRAVQLMLDFYRENPLRKPDSAKLAPGSPEFTLESTRRRGELSLSQMEIQSPAGASQYGGSVGRGGGGGGTPMSTDQQQQHNRGGTQSPSRGAMGTGAGSGKVNGGRHGDDAPARASMVKERGGEEEEEEEEEEEGEEGEQEEGEVSSPAPAPPGTAAAAAAAEIASQMSRGDSDAALKAAANDLSVHEGNNDGGGGLVSPQLKRKSVEPEWEGGGEGGGENREVKRPRLEEGADDDDEGEIKDS